MCVGGKTAFLPQYYKRHKRAFSKRVVERRQATANERMTEKQSRSR